MELVITNFDSMSLEKREGWVGEKNLDQAHLQNTYTNDYCFISIEVLFNFVSIAVMH